MKSIPHANKGELPFSRFGPCKRVLLGLICNTGTQRHSAGVEDTIPVRAECRIQIQGDHQ